MCGDGQLVNDGKYKKFRSHGIMDADTIRVVLQWIWDLDRKHLLCQLLFGDCHAFNLDAKRSYRFAVAMKDRSHYLEWKSFAKHDHVIEGHHA